jgi:hypothetical protein
MSKIRNVFSLILIVMIMATGFPVHQPGDITHDGRIDLQDAVVGVREIASSAHDPLRFKSSLEDAVTAFHVAAGLKKAIKADRSPTGNPLPEVQPPGLISAFKVTPTLVATIESSLSIVPYRSVTLSPVTPPPRMA